VKHHHKTIGASDEAISVLEGCDMSAAPAVITAPKDNKAFLDAPRDALGWQGQCLIGTALDLRCGRWSPRGGFQLCTPQ